LARRLEYRNNNRWKQIEYKLPVSDFFKNTGLLYLTTQRKSDGQAGSSDAFANPIPGASLACAVARGMLTVKDKAPSVKTAARYLFMKFFPSIKVILV